MKTPMKTVVYQSYRTTHVPVWIELCMKTVRAWADANGYEYQFIDDRLFNYAPPWYREKAGGEICPVTDLARLVVAKELFAQGYENTVWVDADMLIFAPERLDVRIPNGFAFCHEIWVSPDQQGLAAGSHKINNSITAFAKNNVHLDFFIDACQRIAYSKVQLGKMDVGTAFLSQLGAILPIPLFTNVGMFSPFMMGDIEAGTEQYLKCYAQHMAAPLACANLCGSLLGLASHPVTKAMDERLYETVIEKCLLSKGDVINRFFER